MTIIAAAGAACIGLIPGVVRGETPPPGPSSAPSSAGALLRQIESGFVEVFERVAPCVVIVEARKPAEAPRWPGEFSFGEEGGEEMPLPQGRGWSEGSGFFVSADGLAVTNQHVVEGAAELRVRMRDGRRLAAKLAGADERSDIAVLRVEGGGFPAAEFGDSDAVRVGQLVCAIGAPYQLEYSFTCGWVSGVGRTNLTDASFEDYIQTDAFINPGNSGGPLFDVEGRVIGMNTLIRGLGRGLSFAIPSNFVREIAGSLAREGRVRRPWIGVRVETLERSRLAESGAGEGQRGVVVQTIFPHSPALKGDVRPADVIRGVDGVEIGAARDLQREIYRKTIGARVVLDVVRGGRRMELPVLTEELPEPGEEARPAEMPQAAPVGGKAAGPHGIELAELPPGMAERLGAGRGGVLVAGVAKGGEGERASLEAGDVILSVDRKDVSTVADCEAALAGKAMARGALVEFDRGGARRYAIVGGEGE